MKRIKHPYVQSAISVWISTGTAMAIIIGASFIFLGDKKLAIINYPKEIISFSFIALALLMFIVYGIYRHQYFRYYQNRIVSFAKNHNYEIVKTASEIIANPSLLSIGEKYKKTENIILGDGWRIGTFSYGIEGKYGKVKTIFYTVMEIPLGRAMPHMLFDSKKSKGRQYRVLYDNAQICNLEADFEKHFTTYFPKHYEIDSASVIGPEVMETLIRADEYDIEIEGDKLYLSSPLISPSEVANLSELGMAIFESIEHELLVYKDSLLASGVERSEITPFGASLRVNPYAVVPALIASVGLMVIGFFLKNGIYVLIGVVMSISSVLKVYRRLQKNKESDKIIEKLKV